MRAHAQHWRLIAAASLAAATVTAGVSHAAAPHPAASFAATPGVACDKGSLPEKTQGRAPAADYADGRAAKGYTCNATQVSHYGVTGGYRVERFRDNAGHVCAYWDSTLLYPSDAGLQAAQTQESPGVYVMDMTNPKHPVQTDTLRTPAMQSPHESLRLNSKRGLLVADMGYPTFNPGVVDVYDVKQDCRHPQRDSSLPIGVLGHEGGFSPDGMTFWVTSLYGHTITAIDLTDPTLPQVLWTSFDFSPHGVSISDDGKTLFMADKANNQQGDQAAGKSGFRGLTILDVSQIQERKANPTVRIISRLTWPHMGTPQNATPFTSRGHHYVLETDEFGSGDNIGAARIINVDKLKDPYVVSNLRLAVHQNAIQDQLSSDPGTFDTFQGYRGHYCSLPSRVDPQIVACSFIASGLRVFSIANPAKPREVAYFNKPYIPVADNEAATDAKAGAFAMSAPAYDPQRHDVWYTDGNSGFFVVHLTAGSGVKSFAPRIVLPGN